MSKKLHGWSVVPPWEVSIRKVKTAKKASKEAAPRAFPELKNLKKSFSERMGIEEPVLVAPKEKAGRPNLSENEVSFNVGMAIGHRNCGKIVAFANSAGKPKGRPFCMKCGLRAGKIVRSVLFDADRVTQRFTFRAGYDLIQFQYSPPWSKLRKEKPEPSLYAASPGEPPPWEVAAPEQRECPSTSVRRANMEQPILPLRGPEREFTDDSTSWSFRGLRLLMSMRDFTRDDSVDICVALDNLALRLGPEVRMLGTNTKVEFVDLARRLTEQLGISPDKLRVVRAGPQPSTRAPDIDQIIADASKKNADVLLEKVNRIKLSFGDNTPTDVPTRYAYGPKQDAFGALVGCECPTCRDMRAAGASRTPSTSANE